MRLPLEKTGQKIKIEKLTPGGQGIGVDSDGKKGFFWNALPDEIVTEYTITKNKSHYFEAIANRVESPSTHRIEPKDSCFLSTSPWQIMDYSYELGQKKKLLIEVFRQNKINIDSFVKNITVKTDNNDYYYRNKMEYALYWDIESSKIKLAFHKRGTHRKEPINQSSIERPEIFAKAQQIVNELNNRHEEARKYQSLLLRSNQNGEVSGGLYENHQPHPDFDNLNDLILGKSYSYSPNGFFQINLPVYEMALEAIRENITLNNVLDLYSGVGTIGLSVARNKNLILVESNKSAFAELEKNCEIANEETSFATPIFAKSEEALDQIAHDQIVILDPPRAGCDKKLIEKLLAQKPEKIIYLSCNPATQARDVKMLLENQERAESYSIKTIIPFNFFPRTPHLENLIVLERTTR